MPAIASSEHLTRRSVRSHAAVTGPRRGEKRDHGKLIRFTAAELAQVIDRARLAGRPVACYVRESSLGPAPRARRTEFSDAVIRALARLATSLPQLAQRARDQHLAGASDFDAAVDDLLSLIRDLE